MNEKREVGGEINEGISLLDLVNIIRSNLLLLFTTILVFLIGGVVYTYVLVRCTLHLFLCRFILKGKLQEQMQLNRSCYASSITLWNILSFQTY